MAIQGSINQMLGTLGTVSALGQHLSDQKKGVEEQNIANTLNAVNQGQGIQQEVDTMKEAIDSTLKEEKTIKDELDNELKKESALKKPNYENPIAQRLAMGKYNKASEKIEAAQKSLSGRLEANRMQQELQNKQREYITKKVELYNSVVGDKAPKVDTNINQS